VTERPIIFSAPMVRALLDGRKTQTRRLALVEDRRWPDGDVFKESLWQRVKPGDRLWVREAWSLVPASAYRCSEGVQQTLNPAEPYDAAIYRAGWDRSTGGLRWRPSIHMPRWASRLTLTVTEVRVQRLQEISRGDAMEEGCPHANMRDGPDPRDWFRSLWNSLHDKFGTTWNNNPEVVALTFTVERRA
jgi:hypothetical protein